MFRVLVVNETNLLGDVIAEVLDDEPDRAFSGLTTSVEEALARATEADIALVSIDLADNGSLRLTRALVENVPCVRVVVVCLMASEKQILRYVEAGAHGYVSRDSSVDDLPRRIRAAHREEALISAGVAAALMRRISELTRLSSWIETGSGEVGGLTPGEREVLDLMTFVDRRPRPST